MEPQRIGEVLETVKPQVTQDHPFGQGLFDETGGGRRDDHLTAMAHRGDAGRPIDVDPEVVVTSERAFAGVHADPDADLRSVGPRIGREPFWASVAASTAPAGEPKTAKKASPSVRISTPLPWSIAARMMALCSSCSRP